MYEGETFSQMFKRTKKCCAKLLRKISFNTATPSRSSAPTRIGGNQSARYIQQKNRPDQTECSPQNSFRSWNSNRSKNVMTSSLTDDLSREEDESQTFRISPKLFTNHGTSYIRVEDNGHSNYCATSAKSSPTQLMGSVLSKYVTKSNSSGGTKISGRQDRDIVLTDKKFCIGINGMQRMSNSSGCSTHNFVPTPTSSETTKSNCSNSSGSTCYTNKNETTSFIVAQNLIEKFDSCMNLAAQNFRNTLSPRISIYNNRVEGGKFCHTVEFNILKEDTSDSNSYHPEVEGYNVEQVVFEKVKYDKNKKYLRHTPSNSSTGSTSSSPKSPCSGTLVSIDRMHSSFSLDDSLLAEEFPTNDDLSSNNKCNESTPYDPNGNFQYDLQGNHQYVSSLPNRYFIQRDGNGNSYGSNKILFDDPWDMFDNKVNKARDKRLLLLRRDECGKGSPKSSSTTLETWVDDELFDNSFNEELERCCIPVDR